MNWSVNRLWVSVAVVGMLCIPRMSVASDAAGAANERITFTGAIVEPTCGVNIERVATLVTAASGSGVPHSDMCGRPNTTVVASQIYTVSVVRLSDAEPDRVLRYFSDYVRAGQVNAPSPILVTQTYE